MSKIVTPYGNEASKKSQVTEMFDNIASKYDLLNRILSLGIDVRWRKKLVSEVQQSKSEIVLDVATGTGDVALMLAKSDPVKQVTGLDISNNMLTIARAKAKRQGLSTVTNFVLGDSEHLLFDDASFDAITIAFGVRNFEDTLAGLAECKRVLKPGGTLFVLEFSRPQVFPIKQLYNSYFKYVLPMIGRLTSKDRKAYTYLFESVQAFPQCNEFIELLRSVGFQSGTFRSLTFGICTLYSSTK